MAQICAEAALMMKVDNITWRRYNHMDRKSVGSDCDCKY